MDLSEQQRAFLGKNHSAAMITLRANGTPHVVRVGVALVESKVWSSGIPNRLRTRHLRRDPRSTLFVFEPGWSWLALESTVTIHNGPDAAQMNLRLFQEMQKDRGLPEGTLLWNNQQMTLEEFLQTMRDEQRLIYEFAPTRIYGFGA